MLMQDIYPEIFLLNHLHKCAQNVSSGFNKISLHFVSPYILGSATGQEGRGEEEGRGSHLKFHCLLEQVWLEQGAVAG